MQSGASDWTVAIEDLVVVDIKMKYASSFILICTSISNVFIVNVVFIITLQFF